MQYRNMLVQTSGVGACDAVNKFLEENPVWHVWQVVPVSHEYVVYVLEGPSKKKPGDNTSGGALKEGATLSERVKATGLRLVA